MARPHSQHLRDPRSRPAGAPRQGPLIAELNHSSRGSSAPLSPNGNPPPPAKPRSHPLTTAASPTEWLLKGRRTAFLPIRVDSCIKTFPRPVNAATRPSAAILRGWPTPNIHQGAKQKMFEEYLKHLRHEKQPRLPPIPARSRRRAIPP